MRLATKYIHENQLLPGTELKLDVKDHLFVEAVIFYFIFASKKQNYLLNPDTLAAECNQFYL